MRHILALVLFVLTYEYISYSNARTELIPLLKLADSELKACRGRLKVKAFSLLKEGAYLDSTNLTVHQVLLGSFPQ